MVQLSIIFQNSFLSTQSNDLAQPQFVYYARLEIREECGTYARAQLYRKKDCNSVVVLQFCDSGDFEGLDGKYSMTEDNKICDSDGDEIEYRNLVLANSDDTQEKLSDCDVITANINFGGKKLSTAFFRRHAIVRIYICLPVS